MFVFNMGKDEDGSTKWEKKGESISDMTKEELRDFIKATMREGGGEEKEAKKSTSTKKANPLKVVGKTAHALTDVLSESVHAIIDITTFGQAVQKKKSTGYRRG